MCTFVSHKSWGNLWRALFSNHVCPRAFSNWIQGSCATCYAKASSILLRLSENFENTVWMVSLLIFWQSRFHDLFGALISFLEATDWYIMTHVPQFHGWSPDSALFSSVAPAGPEWEWKGIRMRTRGTRKALVPPTVDGRPSWAGHRYNTPLSPASKPRPGCKRPTRPSSSSLHKCLNMLLSLFK